MSNPKVTSKVGTETYFHTGNSGTTIYAATVNDHPALITESYAFGHLVHKSELFVNPKQLRDLGYRLVHAAAMLEDKPLYCHVATDPLNEKLGSGMATDSSQSKPFPGSALDPVNIEAWWNQVKAWFRK